MNKGIWAGLVAIAFVAGSILTGTTAFAAAGGQGNDAIVQALESIATAISGINPNVNVEPTPITNDITVESIVGPPGPQGPPGQPGDIPLGSLGIDRLATTFPAVTGSVVLTQPEFNVAGFNQVIASVNLNANNPIFGGAADTFQPFVLVSIRPEAPPPDAFGVIPVEYQGDISYEVVARNIPPQELPGGSETPRGIEYFLQFRLDTQPQPPFPDGSPAPGDTAPAGSKVQVIYRAVFAEYLTP